MKKDQCRTCNADIIWATTTKGTSMPVDYEPAPDGNMIFVQLPANEVRVHVIGPSDQLSGDHARYKSHFATCSEAKAWRKR